MTRRISFEKTIRHEGLGVVRTLHAGDSRLLDEMARSQQARWDAQWRRKVAQKSRTMAKESAQRHIESMLREATTLTAEAEEAITHAQGLLLASLKVQDAIDWDSLKDQREFSKAPPQKPSPRAVPTEPVTSSAELPWPQRLAERLFPDKKATRLAAERTAHEQALAAWALHCDQVRRENSQAQQRCEAARTQYDEERRTFAQAILAQHAVVDQERQRWLSKDPLAIEAYCELVLANSRYPDWVPREYDLIFSEETGVLGIQFRLPAPEDVPRVKDVRYVRAKDDLQESFLSETALDKLYESVCYQLALRTLHEIFEADSVQAIGAIVFNGVVHGIDPAQGVPFERVILSLRARREQFVGLALALVDPKACARHLNAMAGPKLATLTPITPVARLDSTTHRIVDVIRSLEPVEEG